MILINWLKIMLIFIIFSLRDKIQVSYNYNSYERWDLRSCDRSVYVDHNLYHRNVTPTGARFKIIKCNYHLLIANSYYTLLKQNISYRVLKIGIIPLWFYKTSGIFLKFMHNSQSSQLLATLIILLPTYIKIDRVKNVVLIKITNLALRLLSYLLR